eukprot:GHVL01019943.1.p1 GENE.GHVL01019943.1~~GHVL01019943.1.p1  ORF type:complete len:175 (-),score=37.97 GHVL01019943.1:141-665(-)
MRTFSLFFVYFCLLKNITSWRHSVTKASPTGEMLQRHSVAKTSLTGEADPELEQLKDDFTQVFSKRGEEDAYAPDWDDFIEILDKVKVFDTIKDGIVKKTLIEKAVEVAKKEQYEIGEDQLKDYLEKIVTTLTEIIMGQEKTEETSDESVVTEYSKSVKNIKFRNNNRVIFIHI